MATKHYVTFDLPGSFMPELETVEVESRDPNTLTWPEGAYACEFWDREERYIAGEVLRGGIKNKSGRFIRGQVFTLEEMTAQHSDKTILLTNMRGNGWDRVVLCPAGNWQPLLEDDVYLGR